jgi:hypothetical protein
VAVALLAVGAVPAVVLTGPHDLDTGPETAARRYVQAARGIVLNLVAA